MHYVVGSGPFGVACAQALLDLDKGLSVTLLDAGIQLEDSKTQLVQKLSATPLSGWGSESIAALKGGMAPAAKGLPQTSKAALRLRFPVPRRTHVPASHEGVGLRPSLALGGLSNVWGAALREWPISAAQLLFRRAQYHRHLGSQGHLNAAFPLYTKEFGQLNLSCQSRSLLELENMRPRFQPGEFETDILGRPFGWKRVHAADATVPPTIPANTITSSVMANAHRIATESANLS
jgi:hypothetical protein